MLWFLHGSSKVLWITDKIKKGYKMKSKLEIILAATLLLLAQFAMAQETKYSRGLQRVGNTFESVMLIDNQTVLVPLKGTIEFDIQHRFGIVNNGYDDFYGLYAPSNIRLGFSYVPMTDLQVGFGFTKEHLFWDINAKYAVLKETGLSPSAFSLSYFVNMAIDTRSEQNFRNGSDRLSYFHQFMIAKKLSDNFSAQGSVNLSHFNVVEAYLTNKNKIEGKMENDHFSVSLLGRYKLSYALALIANYDQPITEHTFGNPDPNISFGIELATPLHVFQVFIGNYKGIVPQFSNVFNHNDFSSNEIGRASCRERV